MTVQDRNQNQRFNKQFRLGDSIPEATISKLKRQIRDEDNDSANREYREDLDDSPGKQLLHEDTGPSRDSNSKRDVRIEVRE